MSADTYLGQVNDPLSLNVYSYCRNNPLIYWDPTGHAVTDRDLKDNPEGVAGLVEATDEWNAAYAAGDKAGMEAAHAKAEAIRNAAGYKSDDSGHSSGEGGNVDVYLNVSDEEALYTAIVKYCFEESESITKTYDSAKASNEINTSSNLYINDTNITNYTVIGKSQFGSLKSMVEAYGGTVTVSAQTYTIQLGTLSFEIDLNELEVGKTTSVVVKKTSTTQVIEHGEKIKDTMLFTVDCSAIRDANNNLQVLVDIQQFIDFMVEEEDQKTRIKYKLGENGGDWETGFRYGVVSVEIKSNAEAEEFYHSLLGPADLLVGLDQNTPPEAVFPIIAGNAFNMYRETEKAQEALNNDAPYYEFETTRNGTPDFGTYDTVKITENYSGYYLVSGSYLGTFTPK